MKPVRAWAALWVIGIGFGACTLSTVDRTEPCEPNSFLPCYSGPSNTLNVGQCRAGMLRCGEEGEFGSVCEGEVLPTKEDCTTPEDEDCNGSPNDEAGSCCLPQCDGRECGPDGCGGECGTCLTGMACSYQPGKCVYVPPVPGCENLMGGLQPGAPWPMEAYCPSRPGRSPFAGPKTNQLRWAFQTEGAKEDSVKYVRASPVVGADGTIYVGSQDGHLYAIRPDGTPKWPSPFDAGAEIETGEAPLLGSDGTIYLKDSKGWLYAVDRDGKNVWSTKVGGTIYNGLNVLPDGTVLATGEDGLHAVAPNSAEIWKAPVPQQPTWLISTAAVSPKGTVLVVHGIGGNPHEGTLFAFDFAGKEIASWKNANGEFPAVTGFAYGGPSVGADGVAYVATEEGVLHAFDPEGTVKWEPDLGPRIHVPPVVGPDAVYIGDAGPASLRGIHFDGTLKWNVSVPDDIAYLTLDASGMLYVAGGVNGDPGNSTGRLRALSSVDGAVLWTFSPPEVGHPDGAFNDMPAIGADGTLYVGCDNGYVYAIGP